jgi:SAM-dependent methyltransferase
MKGETQSFSNVYEDDARAAAYATLDFPGTYYLAFRDIPALLAEHVRGRTALDFGCGTGRSTRFLQRLGFDTTGIDISPAMVKLATAADPDGTYLVVADGDYTALGDRRFDVILSAFAFDNIPGAEWRAQLAGRLGALLTPGGCFLLLGSRPEIYWHEWASFTTAAAFPDNREARSGDQVRTIMKDVPDSRPVVDQIWFPEDYRRMFAAAGLEVVAEHHPLGRTDEPYEWVNETSVAPWVIYVLRRRELAAGS